MAEVRRLWIEGPTGRLEAMLRVASPARACAVVAHPHPLHGGTMHNPVVFHSDRALHRAGFTTLRFNFRGVGASDGEHDDGNGERGDVAAALAWLRGLGPDVPQLFVGYSFGAWCGYRVLADQRAADAFVAIGLPVRRYSFDGLAQLRVPVAVVQPEHDEFGTPDEVRAVLPRIGSDPSVRIVRDTSHLFPGRASDAAVAVTAAARDLLRLPDGQPA